MRLLEPVRGTYRLHTLIVSHFPDLLFRSVVTFFPLTSGVLVARALSRKKAAIETKLGLFSAVVEEPLTPTARADR
ncbi:MAG: hypothetical protein M1497_02165 [Nitrospirae bacterium]|nr:hypothetical protein [Nitrospirota bacterium]